MISYTFLFSFFFFSCGTQEQKWVSPVFKALGTGATLTLINQENPEKVLDAVQGHINQLTQVFNRYWDLSELSLLNANPNQIIQVSSHLYEVLLQSKNLCENTQVFDVTMLPLIKLWDYKKKVVPNQHQIKGALKNTGCHLFSVLEPYFISKKGKVQFDLGGIAKGYILDEGVKNLKKHFAKKGILEIGGDLVVFGNKTWKVGILDPKTKTPAYVLELKNKALATSGDYERFFTQDGVVYSHILDPRVGKPAVVLSHSVSVIGPKAIICDGLATAFFILGPQESFKILEKHYPHYQAFFILPQGQVLISPHFNYVLKKLDENL